MLGRDLPGPSLRSGFFHDFFQRCCGSLDVLCANNSRAHGNMIGPGCYDLGNVCVRDTAEGDEWYVNRLLYRRQQLETSRYLAPIKHRRTIPTMPSVSPDIYGIGTHFYKLSSGRLSTVCRK